MQAEGISQLAGSDIAATCWTDIVTKGYLHVRGFLDAADIEVLKADFKKQKQAGSTNLNYDVLSVSPMTILRLDGKTRPVVSAVQRDTGITADLTVFGLYFATGRGVDFPWHQDYESYFVFQQHREHLNFYMPFTKPDRRRSNLCLVPFDRVQREIPEYAERLFGSGAQRFIPGKATRVIDDEKGVEYELPVDIEELSVAPELEAGDLLLMRGDVIHRTQDGSTERVAVSLRRTSSTAPISKSRLLTRQERKRETMEKNWPVYEEVLNCFEELDRDEVTAGQLIAYFLDRLRRTAPGTEASS